jgi:hypothetical protein
MLDPGDKRDSSLNLPSTNNIVAVDNVLQDLVLRMAYRSATVKVSQHSPICRFPFA